MVDISRFGEPESAKAKPDISRFGEPESAKAKPTLKEKAPVVGRIFGAQQAAQIPTGGYPDVRQIGDLAGEPSYLEKASMYAAGVPMLGLGAGLLRGATAATKAAPYTARLAEALIPKTLGGLTKATGVAGLSALPAEYARQQVAEAGGGPVAQELTEAGTGLAAGGGMTGLGKGLNKLFGIGYRSAADLAKRAMGSNIKPAVEALVGKAAEPVTKGIAAQEAELARIRDEAGYKTSAESAVQERTGAREKLGGKISKAEAKSGQTQTDLDAALQKEATAQQGVEALDKELLSKPRMSADEFGGKLKSVAQNIKQVYGAAREKAADFKGTFERAGLNPTINTTSLDKAIDSELLKTGDPAKRTFLQTLKSEIKTPELPTDKNKLNLSKAHSVKGYLDRMVAGNQEKDFLVNKNIATLASKFKTDLLKEAVKQHPDYARALSEYRKFSRPLDIVEQRTGKVVSSILDENTLSKESKMADAEAAKWVINKANQGHDVMSRLLSESPELKDAARLHFTQDLFGKDIAPTDAGFAQWLKVNGPSLRQLGLESEFKDMRAAKDAAKLAVDQANGVVTNATKAAEQSAHDAKMLRQMGVKETSRIKEAKTAVGKEKESVVEAIKSKEELIKDYDSLKNDLIRPNLSPSDIIKIVSSRADSMKTKGLITEAQRDELKNDAVTLSRDVDSQKAARLLLKKIAGGLGISALSVAGAEHFYLVNNNGN